MKSMRAHPARIKPFPQKSLFRAGKRGVRDLSAFTAADHYDDYENMYLTEGHFNFKAVRVQDETKDGVLVYRDCDLSDAAVLALHVKSERGGSVEAFVDGVSMGSFTGDTRTCEFRSAPETGPLCGGRSKKSATGTASRFMRMLKFPRRQTADGRRI